MVSVDLSIIANIALGLLAMSGAWVGAYVAIRADLARLHERMQAAHDGVISAHKRIDDLVSFKGIDRRGGGGM